MDRQFVLDIPLFEKRRGANLRLLLSERHDELIVTDATVVDKLGEDERGEERPGALKRLRLELPAHSVVQHSSDHWVTLWTPVGATQSTADGCVRYYGRFKRKLRLEPTGLEIRRRRGLLQLPVASCSHLVSWTGRFQFYSGMTVVTETGRMVRLISCCNCSTINDAFDVAPSPWETLHDDEQWLEQIGDSLAHLLKIPFHPAHKSHTEPDG